MGEVGRSSGLDFWGRCETGLCFVFCGFETGDIWRRGYSNVVEPCFLSRNKTFAVLYSTLGVFLSWYVIIDG